MNNIWEAKPHQVAIAKQALPIFSKYGLVYLAMEERTGKSIIAIEICEAVKSFDTILILTTKKAMEGWQETLTKFPHDKAYVISTYSSVHKVKGKFSAVILDEAHKYISGYPKVSLTWKNVFNHTFHKPLIYCSATPYAQGPQLLFHQFALSKNSPWNRFKTFYDWFKIYAKRDKNGELQTTRIGPAQLVIDYTKVDNDKVINDIKHLFISYTREELGFEQEPEDVLHYIELGKEIKEIYNSLVDDKVLDFTHSETGEDYKLICDSASKLRWALHMLEGGTLKVGENYIALGNTEKVDFILNKWGDIKDIAIMYYFKADLVKLEKYFKNATLLQASTNAEGVDLSHFEHLIIYSQNHSTSQHTQRRARQANINRKTPIKVHYLLVKKAVSDRAYKTVSINKQNFVDTVFERI